MLVTQQPIFRRFWYAVLTVDDLKDGPKPFTLLGEKLVLFLGKDGAPSALQDRCLHRTAKLSKGWCSKHGTIVCGYHGWEFNGDGQLAKIPQLDETQPTPDLKVKSYHCQAKFGWVWVCLEEPLYPIFDIPEDADPSFRRIKQFYEVWNTSSLRLMENSFDNSHFSFVHKGTFGDIDQPKPERYSLDETDYGFVAEVVVPVKNPPEAYRVTGTTEEWTKRIMRNHWYMPFCRRLDMTYPSGLRHIIFNCATPLDDGSIQVIQWLYRNDREEDCSTQELIDWDTAIVAEDRDILESTNPDAIVDTSRKIEAHMPSDRPGLIMRKRLLALMEEHGESEVPAA